MKWKLFGKNGCNPGRKEKFNCSFAARYHRDATEYFTTTKDDDDGYGLKLDLSWKHNLMYVICHINYVKSAPDP